MVEGQGFSALSTWQPAVPAFPAAGPGKDISLGWWTQSVQPAAAHSQGLSFISWGTDSQLHTYSSFGEKKPHEVICANPSLGCSLGNMMQLGAGHRVGGRGAGKLLGRCTECYLGWHHLGAVELGFARRQDGQDSPAGSGMSEVWVPAPFYQLCAFRKVASCL